MSKKFHVLLPGALFLLCGVLPATRVAACSVCLAGDPTFSSQGTTAQSAGDVSAYLEYRSWWKRSGHLPGEGEEEDEEEHGREFEDNEGQRLDLFLSWTPVDRVTLTVDLPVVFNEIVEVEGDERERSRLEGFGDIALQASSVVWRNREVLPSTWLEARAFLKLPTGRSSVRRDGVKDPHLQLGTGSVDFGFGLAGVHRLDWGSLYTSAFYRINSEGSLDYEYGDIFLANAALEVPLDHLLGMRLLDPFTPGFELNYRYSDQDEFKGLTYRDSGGSILYLTPSLRMKLPWFENSRGPSLRGAVQIPVHDNWLRGFQQEKPIYFVGLYYEL